MPRRPAKPMANSATRQFDHCLAIYNPRSTRAARAKWRIDELKALFPDHTTVMHTSAAGQQASKTSIQKHAAVLGPRTLIVVIAGDGTVNLVVEALTEAGILPKTSQQATILPLWGGNANDLATMLNGPKRSMPAQQLLTNGQRVTITPMRCTITDRKGHATTYVAACYASFGASAYAAQWLEIFGRGQLSAQRVPAIRFIRELFMVCQAMMHAPSFKISDDTTTRAVYEQLFINGSRFAKVKGGSLELTEKKFYYTMVERKGFLSVLYHIVNLLRDRCTQVISSGETVSFTVTQAVWAQFDGEVVKVAPGSQVQLSLAESSFHAWSSLV